MITITNGQITLTVPNSAYKAMYQTSGFHPICDEERREVSADTFPAPDAEMAREEISASETDESEASYETDAEEEIDLSEIPLSEMDFYQLCDYADQLGLDRKGLRSKKELRVLIRNNT